jgi:hypothetical protein
MNGGEKREKPFEAKFPKMGTFHSPETAKQKETCPNIKSYNQLLLFNIFS